MPRARKIQLLILTGAVALTIVLYFAPQKINKEKADAEKADVFSFESLLISAKGSLKRQEIEPLTKLENDLAKNKGDSVLLDSLGKQWDKMGQPVISAHYFEMIAEEKPGEKSWLNAAYRFFDASRMVTDSTLRSKLVAKTISAYNHVLEFNPENLDAKTDLGACYAEGTNEPMKGIMLLREVVTKNPEHENAQFNLGILSVRSGQYEKAIERFQKVLAINPDRKEMYFMIGKSYAMEGKKEKALENLEKLKKETTDLQLIEQTNSLINQISSNN